MDGLFNWKRSKQTCDSSEWIIKKECLKIFSNEREKIGVTEKLTLERNIIVAQRNEWGKNIEYHFITFWSNILLFFIKSENRRKSWIPKTFFPVNSFLSFDTFFHIQKKMKMLIMMLYHSKRWICDQKKATITHKVNKY